MDPAIAPTVNHKSSLNASVNVPFNSALGDATFNITISNSLTSLVVTSDNVFMHLCYHINNANALFDNELKSLHNIPNASISGNNV